MIRKKDLENLIKRLGLKGNIERNVIGKYSYIEEDYKTDFYSPKELYQIIKEHYAIIQPVYTNEEKKEVKK